MFKRVLIFFVFFVIACVAAFFWILNSSFATQRIVELLLKRNLHDCTLESLTIGHQRFVYPKQLFFSDISIQIKLKDEAFKINIKSVQINGLNRLISTPVVLQVYGDGLSIESSQIKIPSADLKAALLFRSGSMYRWEGDLSIKDVEAYKYKIQNIMSTMVGDLHKVSFNNLIANFYHGKISGNIDVDWAKGTRFRTDVKFEGVDINALKDVDASVYGQMEGIIQGSFSIGGTTRNFNTLGFKASVTRDGRLNASLLKFVLPYIPRTEESQKLQNLMKQGLKVPVEVATVDIRSIDEHKLSGAVNLGVGQINLNLNLPVDILYDGNLFSLIEWYRKLSK
jgi:hypothetical protein